MKHVSNNTRNNSAVCAVWLIICVIFKFNHPLLRLLTRLNFSHLRTQQHSNERPPNTDIYKQSPQKVCTLPSCFSTSFNTLFHVYCSRIFFLRTWYIQFLQILFPRLLCYVIVCNKLYVLFCDLTLGVSLLFL